MTVYKNISPHTRVWSNVTNPKTGGTLELAPNETIELDQEITDPYLEVCVSKKTTRKSTKNEPDMEMPVLEVIDNIN